MVVDYYKLAEQPFGVTPNPRYLYMTPTHREAMASILYAVMENRGFSALIAPPGMGKTTLLFDLLQRFNQSMRTVFLFQFQPSPEGLLRNLLAELGIPDDGENFVGMQEKLNQAILQDAKHGKRIVVVVDEAQNFHEPVLEVLRMLSNFETSQEKLIHIILSGQPRLAEMLFSPAVEQLRQRVSIMAVLRTLNAEETREYIEHRLRVAGCKSARRLFTPAACELIAEYSGGIPRNINNYCFNALSLGYALKQSTIGREIVGEVFQDLHLAETSANAGKQIGPRTNIPPFGLAPMMVAPPSSSGNALRLTAATFSIAAVLSVAGVLANERLNSTSHLSVAVPAPPPPVAAIETSVPIATADTQAKPEDGAVSDSKPESADSKGEEVRAVTQVDPPNEKQERVRLVKAYQHETLYQLCARNLLGCDPAALREIQRLNPWLHNANQLQAGQPVRVPLQVGGTRSRKSTDTKTNAGEKR